MYADEVVTLKLPCKTVREIYFVRKNCQRLPLRRHVGISSRNPHVATKIWRISQKEIPVCNLFSQRVSRNVRAFGHMVFSRMCVYSKLGWDDRTVEVRTRTIISRSVGEYDVKREKINTSISRPVTVEAFFSFWIQRHNRQ